MSPGANGFEIDTKNSVVGQLKNITGDYNIFDAGGRKVEVRELSTKRIGTTFDLTVKPVVES